MYDKVSANKTKQTSKSGEIITISVNSFPVIGVKLNYVIGYFYCYAISLVKNSKRTNKFI